MDETSVAKVNAAVIDMAASAGIEKEQISPTQLPAGQPGTEAGLLDGGTGNGEAVFLEDIVNKTRTVEAIGPGFAIGVTAADFFLCQGDDVINPCFMIRCFCASAIFFGRLILMDYRRCRDRISGGEDQAIAFASEMEGAAGIVGDDERQALGVGLEVGNMQSAGVGRHSQCVQG